MRAASRLAASAAVGVIASTVIPLLSASALAPPEARLLPDGECNAGPGFEDWTVATTSGFAATAVVSRWCDAGYFDAPNHRGGAFRPPALRPVDPPSDSLPSWARPGTPPASLRTLHTARLVRCGWPLVALTWGSVSSSPWTASNFAAAGNARPTIQDIPLSASATAILVNSGVFTAAFYAATLLTAATAGSLRRRQLAVATRTVDPGAPRSA